MSPRPWPLPARQRQESAEAGEGSSKNNALSACGPYSGKPCPAPRGVFFEIRVTLQLSQASAVNSPVSNENGCLRRPCSVRRPARDQFPFRSVLPVEEPAKKNRRRSLMGDRELPIWCKTDSGGFTM